jgi:DNA-directed RNA polymerase
MIRKEGTVEEQILLEKEKEEEGVNKAVRELHKAIERGEFGDTMYGQVLIRLGFELVVKKLQEYYDSELKTSNQKVVQNLLHLIADDMEVVGYTVLTICINNSINNRPITTTANHIVSRLRDIYLVNRLKKDNPKLHTYLGDKFRRANKRDKQRLIKKHIQKLYQLGEEVEDKAVMVRLGTTLINLVELSGANIIEVKKIIQGHNKTVNVIALTNEAQEVITNLEYSDIPIGTINKLPMIVEPKDWTNNYDGGFYKGKNSLFTVKSGDVAKHLRKQTYPKIYPVINRLQKTAWRVNTGVLEVIKHIFDNNMIDPVTPAKAPKLFGDLPTREKYTWEQFIKESDYEKWHDFNREREDITIRQNAENTKRLELIYTIAVAERMKEYAALYYPYMMDYRGRVYSDVNFLTPQGQHYTKSMLEFAEGRKLDDTGIRWLKIHTANVYGKDKEVYSERLEWFDANEQMLIDIALNPLDNLGNWVYADSPFEFLAACMAWVDHKTGMPVHLPIQLDATCSGIQMYSGLLRDKVGAESVNVIGKKRNDIYQMVADRVDVHLKNGNYSKWIEYTDKEGQTKSEYAEPVAKSMIGNITRGIVKRNVMTVPYSVTRQGMSNQIWDKIDEATLKGKEFWTGSRWVANKLLTQLNHTAIYEIIDGAKKGQEYLVGISKLLDKPATWNGVLYDFPVRQTALSLKEKRVKTVYGALVMNVEVPKLNKRRQSNSIAPNFVHNIDSTILLYCIEHMSNPIGVIHDCFLVHPNDGDEIQYQYKEGFIAVMEADPLRNIQEQLDPEGLVEFPEYGELDLNEVRDSDYIIS